MEFIEHLKKFALMRNKTYLKKNFLFNKDVLNAIARIRFKGEYAYSRKIISNAGKENNSIKFTYYCKVNKSSHTGNIQETRKIIAFKLSAIKNSNCVDTYIEPFAGGAAIAIGLLINGIVQNVIINDINVGIYSFWKSIVSEPKEFIELIRKYQNNIFIIALSFIIIIEYVPILVKSSETIIFSFFQFSHKVLYFCIILDSFVFNFVLLIKGYIKFIKLLLVFKIGN